MSTERSVATYLAVGGQVFIASQYDVEFDSESGDGGTCPDFVALDFGRREVVVVEVTAAADWRKLADRVKRRETAWYRPIRRQLQKLNVIDDSWPVRFLGFVCDFNVNAAKSAFASDSDVTFCAIEEATFPWRYWEERVREGLPR